MESRKQNSLYLQVDRESSDQESMWDGFKYGGPMGMSGIVEDFHKYVAGDWTVTETQPGATEAVTDTVHGALLITNSAADNDLVGMQLVPETFVPTAGRNIYFECRLQVNNATESDWACGLAVKDITFPATPADGIFFRKDDDDIYIDALCVNTAVVSTENAIATNANATYVTLGFRVVGTSYVDFWVNGVKKTTINTSIPTTQLSLSFALQNGEAVAKTMLIDYICAYQER